MLKADDNKPPAGLPAEAQYSGILAILTRHHRIWSGPEIRKPQERKLCNNSNAKCVTISAPNFSQT